MFIVYMSNGNFALFNGDNFIAECESYDAAMEMVVEYAG